MIQAFSFCTPHGMSQMLWTLYLKSLHPSPCISLQDLLRASAAELVFCGLPNRPLKAILKCRGSKKVCVYSGVHKFAQNPWLGFLICLYPGIICMLLYHVGLYDGDWVVFERSRVSINPLDLETLNVPPHILQGLLQWFLTIFLPVLLRAHILRALMMNLWDSTYPESNSP